jgi:hypothetical protein
LSGELVARTEATVEDRLQRLSLLKHSDSPEFASYLGLVKAQAGTNAVELYAVSVWMIREGMAEAALAWLESCPPQTMEKQPAPMALVDCYVATTNWVALEEFLLKQKWEQLDYVRLAYLSRSAAEQRQEQGAEVRWRSAVRAAGERVGALRSLVGMARAWGRGKAEEDLLWEIGRRFVGERWAYRELESRYSREGKTVELNKVLGAMAAQEPKSVMIRNNYAATSLLLNQNTDAAHQAARDLYLAHPEEAVVASTYAYSLLLRNEVGEGLAVMGRVRSDELEEPGIALYYGVLLAESGKTNEAGVFFDRARGGTGRLLPEERGLLARYGPGKSGK